MLSHDLLNIFLKMIFIQTTYIVKRDTRTKVIQVQIRNKSKLVLKERVNFLSAEAYIILCNMLK